jgi:hypothetical protein
MKQNGCYTMKLTKTLRLALFATLLVLPVTSQGYGNFDTCFNAAENCTQGVNVELYNACYGCASPWFELVPASCESAEEIVCQGLQECDSNSICGPCMNEVYQAAECYASVEYGCTHFSCPRDLSTGAVFVIVIVVLLLLGGAGVGGYVLWKKKRSSIGTAPAHAPQPNQASSPPALVLSAVRSDTDTASHLTGSGTHKVRTETETVVHPDGSKTVTVKEVEE